MMTAYENFVGVGGLNFAILINWLMKERVGGTLTTKLSRHHCRNEEELKFHLDRLAAKL